MNRIGLIIAVLLAFVLLACQQHDFEQAADTAAATISAERLAEHVQFLAHDSLQGRAPATPGGEIAMRYIAAEYEKYGLKPGAADGSWYQYFDIIGITTTSPKTMQFRRGGQSLGLKWWSEFISFSGVQQPVAEVKDAEIVFVGYGIEAPEYDWNDYKDVDVSGKILLMMNNDPGEGDEEFFAGNTRLYYGRWSYKYEKAAEKGAAGAIIIHTTPSAGYPFQVVQTSWTGEQFELPQQQGTYYMPFKGWVTNPSAERLAKLAGRNLDTLRARAERRDFRPVPLGVRLSFRMQNSLRSLKTANVLGLLPGSDPGLRDQVVVYTAHHDHLGIGTPVAGDSIYNGARDNASGVACMLEVARAMTSMSKPPRRSTLFAAVAAEESGLLGSAYYARHPTFPPGKIAANINFDAVNIWGETNDIEIIGYGKSEMDDYVREVAALQGRQVKPDQSPDKGFFYRSDQFNFAKIGVPAVYLGVGSDFVGREAGWGRQVIDRWTATKYHQPSDEYDPNWDLGGAVQSSQLCLRVGVRVGNAESLPQWYPGDEFEAARKQAIAAAAKK